MSRVSVAQRLLPRRVLRGVVSGMALGVAGWGIAAAQLSDVPLHVEADSIRYNYNTATSVYEGNVAITQGDMRLTGDRVEVFSESGEVSRLVSQAVPSTFQRISGDDDSAARLQAEAERIEYDIRAAVVVFVGDAVVKDGEKVLSGHRIVYDIKKKIVNAPQGKGRVRLTITP